MPFTVIYCPCLLIFVNTMMDRHGKQQEGIIGPFCAVLKNVIEKGANNTGQI